MVPFHFFLMLMAEQFIFSKNPNKSKKGRKLYEDRLQSASPHQTYYAFEDTSAILSAKSGMDLTKSCFFPTGVPIIMNTLAECIVFGCTCAVYLEPVTSKVVLCVYILSLIRVINSTEGSLLLTGHAVPKCTHKSCGSLCLFALLTSLVLVLILAAAIECDRNKANYCIHHLEKWFVIGLFVGLEYMVQP